jgi:hypothetical protein
MVEERNSLCDRYDSTFEADVQTFHWINEKIFKYSSISKDRSFVQKISFTYQY